MGTTAQKLSKVLETKNLIKTALIERGIPVADEDAFGSYANKLNELPTMYISNALPDNAKDGDYCILINP